MESTILLVLVVVLVAAVGGYWWFFMRKGAGSSSSDMMGGSNASSMDASGSDGMNPPSANLTMDTEGMDMGGSESPMEETTSEEGAPAMPESSDEETDMGIGEAPVEQMPDVPAEGEENMEGEGEQDETKTA